ncbi:MAG: Omp28-related outer membrane protein [Bacteroidales bacterium]|jgi:hypothetical protein|nr:Omp28-related outer membrane protein [Bacteroidales bacterium]
MKRQYNKIWLSVIISALALFVSCGNIEENEILTPLFFGETSQTATITNTESRQRVLLEDYTGWKCTNCPTATEVVNNLLTQYDNLIVMAVHAGGFATPAAANDNLDLRTPYGNQWNADFGLTSYPVGVINRVKENGSVAVSYNDWQTKIEQRSQREHVLDINLGASVEQNSKIIISCENKFLQSYPSPTLINVLVLENSITGLQANGNATIGATPWIDNYQFNHVLRDNGITDFPLTANEARQGDTVKKNYYIGVKKEWNLSNCHVIVFVTDAATKEVLQVNEVALH